MHNLDSNVGKRGLRGKTPAHLSEPLAQKLNAYTLAAATAGVAIFACAMPAEAAPVCKKLSTDLLSTATFPLNPADQAVAPFNIAQTSLTYRISTTGRSQLLWWNRGFFTPNSAAARVLLGAKNLPADVAFGAEIGPGGQFGKGASYGLMFTYGKGNFSVHAHGTKLQHRGNLSLTQESYLGFQFSEAGKTHYGWARLEVTFRNNDKHTVLHMLGFGYESTPNTAIAAGSCAAAEINKNPVSSRGDAPRLSMQDSLSHPHTSRDEINAPARQSAFLGVLALGSDGLSLWRKKQ